MITDRDQSAQRTARQYKN